MPARTVPLWWEASEMPARPPARLAGRSVLLVPDAHRCAGGWSTALLAGLVTGGHRPVLVDLRDQGRSPWSEGVALPYTLADVASDLVPVAEAVAALDGHPPVLMGHGFGASVAVELAGCRPELVGGLVAVGATGWFVDPTLPGPDEPVAVGLIWRSRLADAADPAERPAPNPAGRASLARALARELRMLCTSDDDPGAVAAVAEVERWLAWGFNPADRHRAAWVGAPPAWEGLGRRRHLLAAVHGAGDPFVPLPHGERLADVAGASLRVVDGGGHALTAAFVPEVLAAVDEVAAAARR